MDYRDRVVIVTGASSGIGRVTARAFAERGAVVVALARREAELASLVAECARHSPRSHYLAGDLAERAFAASVVDTAARRHGRIDVLVDNAKDKQIHHVSVEEAEYVMNVNFHSCLWLTFAALPHLLRFFCPPLLRFGMRRMDPVSPEVIAHARKRADAVACARSR